MYLYLYQVGVLLGAREQFRPDALPAATSDSYGYQCGGAEPRYVQHKWIKPGFHSSWYPFESVLP